MSPQGQVCKFRAV